MRTLAFSTAGGRAVKSLLGYRQHNWVTNLWNSSCKEKAVKGQERRREFCKIQEKCRQVRRNWHRRMSVGKVWRKAGMSYVYGNNGYVYLPWCNFSLSNNVEIPFPFKIYLSNIYSFLSQLLLAVRFFLYLAVNPDMFWRN